LTIKCDIVTDCSQLDIVGIKVGHLPPQPPFSLTVTHSRRNSTNGLAKRSSQKISKADFLSSVEDREAFYDLYVAITNRAIDLYAKGGRRKFALKLHGTLAALDVCVPIVFLSNLSYLYFCSKSPRTPFCCSADIHITTRPLCTAHVEFFGIIHVITGP
jgi:hypothetical protein